MVDTGGAQRHPASTERLLEYWARGKGAAVINWGVDGDFDRCVIAITKAVDGKLSEPAIKGLCSNLHVRVTGAHPGRAPGETAPRKAAGK